MRENISMFEILKHYRTGMAAYDRCHPPKIRSQWSAFTAELKEFIAEPSLDEASDVLHSFGRLVWKMTGIPLQWLAYPTVRKHGERFVKTGCIRSRRNCEGRCCDRDY
ncbi:hypothetical protein H6F69_06300 [Leptolyngbya sp. FACHB-1624]|nr:hypothetical protein [Leptolyngbya sp. FACHB-1624]